MKIKALLLPVLFCSITTLGQQQQPRTEYSAAKDIIRDLDTIVNPNGLQESYEAPIGGIKQWLYVRGQNKENPIILFLHGGPASPMSPVMWMYQRPLEEYFTVVNYDQRAAGKTYGANDTLNLGQTITIDQYVKDGIALTEFLQKKYQKRKVILMGHSWGTIVAMHMALKRPDLFYAYVGIGQVINTLDNEQLSYKYGVEQATQQKNETALKELKSIEPYPGSQPLTIQRIIIARKWSQYYGGMAAFRSTSNYFHQGPLLSSVYSEKNIDDLGKGNRFTLSRILPEFLSVDFKSVKKFPIPVFMFMGRHDYTTPAAPTVLWLKNVDAPLKKEVWFENSAHLLPFEEPGKLLVSLLNEVKPLTVEN